MPSTSSPDPAAPPAGEAAPERPLDAPRAPAASGALAARGALARFPAALRVAVAEAGAADQDLALCPYCRWVEASPGRWTDPGQGRIDLGWRRLVPGLCPACARVEGVGG